MLPAYMERPDFREWMSATCHGCFVVYQRNLKGHAFGTRLDEEAQREVTGKLRAVLEAGPVGGRKFQCESPCEGEARSKTDPGEKWTTKDGMLQVRLGGANHLEVVASTSDLPNRWERLLDAPGRVVRDFEKALPMAADRRLGHYTASADMMGSGVRAGFLLQLGGLRAMGHLARVENALNEWGMNLNPGTKWHRGAAGGCHWVVNRVTMGLSDYRVIYTTLRAASHVAEAEWAARQKLLERQPMWMADRVGRAIGLVERGRLMGYREALETLTWLEIGSSLSLCGLECTMEDVTRAMQRIDPSELGPRTLEATKGAPETPVIERMARIGILKNLVERRNP